MSPPDHESELRIRDALLEWYDREHRTLPWRGEEVDPYRVLVSEFMLQQTRVDTVTPYYERWMRTFPTLSDLAEADLESVLAVWSGLGYYSRARRLHETARRVRDHHDGALPDTIPELLELPGIGAYTAGAIASIAYDRAEPAVDGNARRVLCRVFDLEEAAPRNLDALARRLVCRARPGDFNQGLMELGARVCTPRNPDCPACPLVTTCRARERGTIEHRPAPRRARRTPTFEVGTAVILSPAGHLALTRRRSGGLLGGMWEFPGLIAEPEESPIAAARRTARAILDPLDVDPIEPEPLPRIRHAFSHRRHVYHPYVFQLPGEPRLTPCNDTWSGAGWHDLDALERRPLPSAQRQLARSFARSFPC